MPELFTDITPATETIAPPIAPETEAIKPPESLQEDKLSQTFQRIAKQENHVKAERAKIDLARKELEAEKIKADKYSSLEGKDPFSILEHFGISYDKLLEADKQRRNPIDPNIKKALESVEQLKSQLNDREQEVIKEKRSRAEIELMTNISKTIKEHEFDVIEQLGAEPIVREYMEEMYSLTGEIPDYKDACQAVTDDIVNKYQKISNSKWVKPKEEIIIKEEVPVGSKTLTNKMVQSSVANDRPMTDSERFKAALQTLNTR